MTTKTITRPLSHWLPDIATREEVPVNWLASLSTRIKAEIPDDEESAAVISGLGACTVSWPHTLSEVEQLQATVAEMQAKAEQIKALLPIEGGVSAAAADKLRELLKTGTVRHAGNLLPRRWGDTKMSDPIVGPEVPCAK